MTVRLDPSDKTPNLGFLWGRSFFENIDEFDHSFTKILVLHPIHQIADE